MMPVIAIFTAALASYQSSYVWEIDNTVKAIMTSIVFTVITMGATYFFGSYILSLGY